MPVVDWTSSGPRNRRSHEVLLKPWKLSSYKPERKPKIDHPSLDATLPCRQPLFSITSLLCLSVNSWPPSSPELNHYIDLYGQLGSVPSLSLYVLLDYCLLFYIPRLLYLLNIWHAFNILWQCLGMNLIGFYYLKPSKYQYLFKIQYFIILHSFPNILLLGIHSA